MDKKAFKKILVKYLNNSCTPKEAAFVDEWFSRIGRREQSAMTDEDERKLFERYDVDLQEELRKREAKVPVSISHSHLWYKLAAMIVVVIGVALYFYQDNLGSSAQSVASGNAGPGMREMVNDGASAYSVYLSDGSEIVLNPDSKVSFRYPFEEGTREVKLEGEAFFNVVPDPASPFVVRTEQLMTKVLGTSFTVKANRHDENIFVTVKTGKVLVKQLPSEMEEVLNPNEQVVYNIPKGSISRAEVPAPVTENPVGAARIRFKEATIAEVLRAVERTYSTGIIFDEETFSGCRLSTSVSGEEDLFSKLDIICKAIGATYKVDGISVVVSGNPCKQNE